MKKISKKLNYNSGIFNSKNEKILGSYCNFLKDEINKVIEHSNQLQNKIDLLETIIKNGLNEKDLDNDCT